MKKVFIYSLFALACSALNAQTTSFSNEEKMPMDFEKFLVKFYQDNYLNYFIKACNINKAEVSFDMYENGKISDVSIKSPRKDIDSFLIDGIKASQKEWKLASDDCGNLKTVSFIAYFNFAVDCDPNNIRIGNYDHQKPSTSYVYKSGFKIIKEDEKGIVLDKIVFHGFFDNNNSPFSKGN